MEVKQLHDWIDELSAVLDVEADVDDGLLLDLARSAAHHVARPAAPITTYLIGYAAGLRNADADAIETMVARAQALADGWNPPEATKDPDQSSQDAAAGEEE